MLESYLDESFEGDDRRSVFIVAGWLGDSAAWRSLEAEWQQALRRTRPRVREFKASDCFNGVEQFSGWSMRRRHNLVARLMNIIRCHEVRGATVVLTADGPLPRKHGDYLLCVATCMTALTTVASVYPTGERVAYIVDDRDKIRETVQYYRRRLRESSIKRISQRVGPLAFDDSAQVLPLQAADLLAHVSLRTARRAWRDDKFNLERSEVGPLMEQIAVLRFIRWDNRHRQLRWLHPRTGRWTRLAFGVTAQKLGPGRTL